MRPRPLLLLTLTAVLGGVAGIGAQAPPSSEARVRADAARWFGGALARLPEDTKIRLVETAHRTPNGVRALTSETYRGKLYLEVLLNSSTEEQHTGPPVAVDRLAAVSRVADARLIPALFEYATALGETPDVYGVKLLLIELPANSFIQLYAPLSVINEARAGKITKQALLDGSVIHVNNDIVKLRATESRP